MQLYCFALRLCHAVRDAGQETARNLHIALFGDGHRCLRHGLLLPVSRIYAGLRGGCCLVDLLVVAFTAYYAFRLKGAARLIYVVAAIGALYFNCFILVMRSFLTVPALHALMGLPFAVAQGAVLIFFLVAGALAVKRYRPMKF